MQAVLVKRFKALNGISETHNFRELDLEGVYAGNFNYYKDAHGDNYVINKADGSAPKKLEGFSNVKKYGKRIPQTVFPSENAKTSPFTAKSEMFSKPSLTYFTSPFIIGKKIVYFNLKE